MWIYIWLGVLAVSLILEFVSLELVSIWVSVGALFAMILAVCGVPLVYQIIVFIVVSVACILGLRKITLKLLTKNQDKTNLDTVLGTKVKLIKAISDDEMGKIKINGVEWSVKALNSQEIKEGTFVEIVAVEGNKFIVKEVVSQEKFKPSETSKVKVETNNSLKVETKKSSKEEVETKKDNQEKIEKREVNNNKKKKDLK